MIGALLAATLVAIATLHLIWGLGISWPITDEARLAKSVVGAPGITRMPPRWASLLVAAALMVAAVLILSTGGYLDLRLPDWVVKYAIYTMIGVFGLRGLVSYLPAWRRRVEPLFDGLNTRFYGPLCLLIAAGAWTQL